MLGKDRGHTEFDTPLPPLHGRVMKPDSSQWPQIPRPGNSAGMNLDGLRGMMLLTVS